MPHNYNLKNIANAAANLMPIGKAGSRCCHFEELSGSGAELTGDTHHRNCQNLILRQSIILPGGQGLTALTKFAALLSAIAKSVPSTKSSPVRSVTV